jgi:hypothetical protein
VIKGYQQEKGVNFKETYTPVRRLASLRLVLSLAAQNGWEID